ncbi:hypothetical protein GBA52_021485 [Prunus armeniaca]|nr:hypothetical protein GBA52_021485 [Prunus armeniaca]
MSSGNLTLPHENITECIEFPPNIHSPGLFKYKTAAGIPYTLPNLELQMVLVFFMTKAFYSVLRYLGVSRFTAQIITGLILGPTFLGKLPVLKQYLFNLQSQEILGVLSEFGYGFFMFLIGVKMDLGMINRTGQKALCSGIACVLVPLVVAMLVQTKLTSSYFKLTADEMFKLPFMTATHCLTPFPVVACLLEDLKILNSEIGRLGMSAALVSDMFSAFLLFLGTLAKMVQESSARRSMLGIGSSIGYIIVVVAILRPAMYWVIRQTPENRPVKKAYLNIIIIVVLSSGVLSHMYGQGFHFGPFILGLAVPAGPPLGSAIEANLGLFVSDVLLPIFVTISSMRTDFLSLKYFKTDAFTQVNGILILVALVAKFLASLAGPLYCNMASSDALAIALILSCKGIVNLAAYTNFRDNQVPVFSLSNVKEPLCL